ncbi:MAG: hypothetical protein KC609_06630 [Myxococcales bacterium]|nr:hypothetical protein [Myxococcales bacterium]
MRGAIRESADRRRWWLPALLLIGLIGCKGSEGATGCQTNDECGGDRLCVSGQCVSPTTDCTSNLDCGALRYCDNGTCLGKSCQQNKQCVGGVCKKGVCSEGTSASCTSNIDCTSKQQCSGGQCVDLETQLCGCTPEETCTLSDPRCESRACQTNLDCSDDNICTSDSCENGICKNVKLDPACCRNDTDCKVSNVCAPERCSDGKCVVIGTPDPTCCDSHADCNDSNPCTTDRCLNNHCVNVVESTDPACECSGTQDCNDKNSCTADACIAGKCQYTFVGGVGCCKKDDECNDNDPSTEDRCIFNACSHKKLTPCTNDLQCEDQDACTTDQCVSGFCQNDPVDDPLCCNKNANCDDLSDSTLDRCVANRCVHSLTEEPETCTFSGDCKSGTGACVTAECVSGFCSYTIKKDGTCCSKDTDCDDGNSCTENTCVDFSCKTTVKSDAGCCTADADCKDANECTSESCVNNKCKIESSGDKVYWKANFESGNDGFTFEGGAQNVTWQVTDYKKSEGSYSLYYGDISTHTYDSPDQSNKGTATSPAFVVPDVDDVKLTFKVFIETESSFVSYDSLTISIKSGSDVTAVWDKGDVDGETNGEFVTAEIDVSKYKGKTIQLIIEFDTGDAYSNDYEGVYIDDMKLAAPCLVKSCQGDTDCNDNNKCTADICDPQTKICKNDPIAGCCLTDTDCDDQNTCTIDSCNEQGQCVHQNTCCSTDDECKDTNDCTIDTCVAGACVYKLKQDPLCCVPNLLTKNFDDGTLGGFVVEDDGSQVKWQVTNLRSFSGSYSLYFGDPATHNYSNGSIVKGSATSPEVLIPAGGEAKLRFYVWLRTESSSTHDKVWITALQGDQETQVWAKTAITSSDYQKWIAQEVDLTPFAGKPVKLKFYFDSVDSSLNTYEGVYFDDVRVTMPCVVQKCTLDSDCEDFNACTTNKCSSGTCTYAPIAGCCLKDADCDDQNSCTKDSCVENVCKKEVLCCKQNGDCNDNDSCTTDTCESEKCVFTLDVNKTGCCKSNLYSESFDGTTATFEFDGNSDKVKWQTSKIRAYNGTTSLYFGDIDKLNYVGDGNAVNGTATSQEITLQPGVDALIRFQLYIDVEASENFDQLTVQILEGTSTKTVWEKKELTSDQYKKWVQIQVSVPGYGGKKVKVRFKFDSKDGAGNTQEGVYIDNVIIGSKCTP